MFTKKQFITLLAVAAFVFIIIATICYWLAYEKGLGDTPVNPNGTIETFKSEAPIIEVEDEAGKELRILPSTKIITKLLDQEGYVLEEGTIDTLSLLSKTMLEVQELFKTYTVEKFTAEEVILTKQMYIPKEAPSFSLGIEKNQIGIVVGGSKPSFTPLGLSTRDFSSRTVKLLEEKEIPLTIEQKRKLEKNAYYIEEILQNYSE